MLVQTRGFTLIELLVVISIIGILSTVAVTSLVTTRDKARYSRVRAEMDQFAKTVAIAQGESGKFLKDITLSGCSECFCTGRDVKNVATTDNCYIKWNTALVNIQNATNGTVSNLTSMTRDPWGSPYGLDENDREGGALDCRLDLIRSAGPDGIMRNSDDLSRTMAPLNQCP